MVCRVMGCHVPVWVAIAGYGQVCPVCPDCSATCLCPTCRSCLDRAVRLCLPAWVSCVGRLGGQPGGVFWADSCLGVDQAAWACGLG